MENTVLSEENLSGPNKDGPKENREGMGRNIIGKRPVQKEVVKQSGPKRQKITEKVFDMIQSNRDERSERQENLEVWLCLLNSSNNPPKQ